MTLSGFFYGLGDIFLWTFQIFEVIGNVFNYSLIVLGFFGLFFWLNLQKKYNAEAEHNSDQIK